MKRHTPSTHGFSMPELLVVLVILIALFAIGIPLAKDQLNCNEKIRLVNVDNLLIQVEIAKIRSLYSLSDEKKPCLGKSVTSDQVGQFLNIDYGRGNIDSAARTLNVRVVSLGEYPTSTNSTDGRLCLVEDLNTHKKYDINTPPYDFPYTDSRRKVLTSIRSLFSVSSL